jgi:integral membrane protein
VAGYSRKYYRAGCKLLITKKKTSWGRNANIKKTNKQKLLHRFRMIGIAEGISFLVLLLIAMPLKYMMHIPEAVKFNGWVHGVLFVTFIYFAFEVMGALNKSFLWFLKAFAAAFIPFGTFVFDRELRRDALILTES